MGIFIQFFHTSSLGGHQGPSPSSPPPIFFQSWWFSTLLWSSENLNFVCPLWVILIPCKVAWISHIRKSLGTSWISSQCSCYCPLLSCSCRFLLSVVYGACFPSGTPVYFAIGHILVWAPIWLPLVLVPVFCHVVINFLGGEAILGILK